MHLGSMGVAKMSARSSELTHRCFTAVAGQMVEFSITLAADAIYGARSLRLLSIERRLMVSF
jgi:hypothetical protein